MEKPDISKNSAELADKLSELDSREKERVEILAQVAQVRARFEAKKKQGKEKKHLIFR